MIRNRIYLNFLATQPCLFCGIEDGTVVGHHIRIATDGGMGIKPSDCYAVPLCFIHHSEVHSKGEVDTFIKYGFNFEPKEIGLTLYNKYEECKNGRKT